MACLLKDTAMLRNVYCLVKQYNIVNEAFFKSFEAFLKLVGSKRLFQQGKILLKFFQSCPSGNIFFEKEKKGGEKKKLL